MRIKLCFGGHPAAQTVSAVDVCIHNKNHKIANKNGLILAVRLLIQVDWDPVHATRHNNKSCLQIQQESGEPNSMPGWLLKKKLAPMDPVTNKPLTENEFEEHNFACVLCLKLLCHMCVEDTELCYECRHQRGSKGGTIAKGKIKEKSIICYNHYFVRQQEKTDIFVLFSGFMNKR